MQRKRHDTMKDFFDKFEKYCKTPEVTSNKPQSYSNAIKYLCDYMEISEITPETVEEIKSIEENISDKNSAFYKGLLTFLTRRNQKSYLESRFILAALKPFFKFVTQEFSNIELVFPGEISDNDVKQLHEGAVKNVNVNVYERNPEAREICINKYGCKCVVCDMDFQKTYGDIGKGFIHVHHIIPLHNIRFDYVVNGETDLIPVCPNCHAMLHKSIDGKFMTVEDLRNIINSK